MLVVGVLAESPKKKARLSRRKSLRTWAIVFSEIVLEVCFTGLGRNLDPRPKVIVSIVERG